MRYFDSFFIVKFVSLSILLTYLNFIGLDVVGSTAIIVCLLSIIPFLPFCIIGAFQVDPSNWFEGKEGGLENVEIGKFLNIAFWTLNYWVFIN